MPKHGIPHLLAALFVAALAACTPPPAATGGGAANQEAASEVGDRVIEELEARIYENAALALAGRVA